MSSASATVPLLDQDPKNKQTRDTTNESADNSNQDADNLECCCCLTPFMFFLETMSAVATSCDSECFFV